MSLLKIVEKNETFDEMRSKLCVHSSRILAKNV